MAAFQRWVAGGSQRLPGGSPMSKLTQPQALKPAVVAAGRDQDVWV